MGSPVIGELDGEYDYDSRKHVLNWRLPLVDSSNKEGSLEFSVAGIPTDFFPVTVSFASSKSYCHIEVSSDTVGAPDVLILHDILKVFQTRRLLVVKYHMLISAAKVFSFSFFFSFLFFSSNS